MSNVEFQNAIPSDFVLDRPVSTSKSILRKNLVQYLPTEQTTFDPTTNNIIRFQVASNSDILLGAESYFTFDFQQTNSNQNAYFALDVGGIQSLLRTIEIRALGSGILLQRYDQYHKWNAIQSLLLDDPSMVDPQGAPAGDSLYAHYVAPGSAGSLIALTGTALTTSAGAITGTSTVFTKELKIGDEVVIKGTDINSYPDCAIGRITAIASDTAATMTVGAATTMTTAGAIYKRAGMYSIPARRLVGDGSVHTLAFRPILSLLNHALPLFLLKGGIEVSFELELPSRCVSLARDGISDSNCQSATSYQITGPRFFGMMATPHPDIVDEFINQWRSPTGLVYSIPSVRYRRWSSAANVGDDNLHFNPGVRSARKMYMIIQDSSMTEGASSGTAAMYPAACKKISMGIRDSVTKFQCQVGSSLYPLNGLDLDQDSYELKEQLKNVSGNFGPQRLSPYAWQSNNASGNSTAYLTAASTFAYDASSYIFGADLSRDDGPNGSLTGTDLSVVPLDINLQRSQVHNASSLWQGSPVYHVFIVHDSFLKISSEQMSVMN